jgi:Tfp pilus assembly ATPase PilU
MAEEKAGVGVVGWRKRCAEIDRVRLPSPLTRQVIDQLSVAIIDGQAGTGKSFSMEAICKGYEAQEDEVIG